MMKQCSFLVLGGGLVLSGCSRTASTPLTSQSNTARRVVNAVTGNAGGARAEARELRRQSDALLAAKDYKGAMDKRWQLLGVRGKDPSNFGALTSYAIQQLALGDIANIASHLDAPSCRDYAEQLRALDASAPTYTAILEHQKTTEIERFKKIIRKPKEWQDVIVGVGLGKKDQTTLLKTPVASIQSNIGRGYDVLIHWSKQPYSSTPPAIVADPYTKNFALPYSPVLARFLWAKYKTDRVLIIAALLNRYENLEKQTLSAAPLPDPFGTKSLNTKNNLIYSIGPDAKDDGGKTVPSPDRVMISDKGDMLAPSI